MEEALQITASVARGEPETLRVFIPELGKEIEQKVYPDFNDRKNALEHFYKINGAFLDRQSIETSGGLDIKVLWADDDED